MVGGASGMCRATAEAFHKKGGKVAILDLGISNGEAVAKDIDSPFFPCDVGDCVGMEKTIADAVGALGGLDFCVNSAGITECSKNTWPRWGYA